MCLIALAYKAHPRFPLIVAANRDEFMDRPTEPAHWWKDAPGIFAGRDKRAGGTWMGINRRGRFAAITNYRQMQMQFPAGPSRG
ncbi:MAG TPA: NRDE family protein, partial [Flavobacteriales bacterium]|nr:NRDE family protein [Flavobacteriales bacterium]